MIPRPTTQFSKECIQAMANIDAWNMERTTPKPNPSTLSPNTRLPSPPSHQLSQQTVARMAEIDALCAKGITADDLPSHLHPTEYLPIDTNSPSLNISFPFEPSDHSHSDSNDTPLPQRFKNIIKENIPQDPNLRMDHLESDLQQVQDQILESHTDHKRYYQDCQSSFQNHSDALSQLKSSLQQTSNTMDHTHDELQVQVARVKNEIHGAIGHIDQVCAGHSKTELSQVPLEQVVENLKEHVYERNEEVSTLEASVKETQGKLEQQQDQLEDVVSGLRMELEKIEKEVSCFGSKLETLQGELKEAQIVPLKDWEMEEEREMLKKDRETRE